MHKLFLLTASLACALAACGPSDDGAADAERAKSARGTAAVAGLAEPPVDLGEGLILTVLQRGSGAFVPAGGRVRVHYDASVVAVSEAPAEEPAAEEDAETPQAEEALGGEPAADAQAPAEGSAPVEGAAPAAEGATEPAAGAASEAETQPAPDPAAETPQEPAVEAVPASDAPASAAGAQDPTVAANDGAEGATADPAAPAAEAAAAPAEAASEPAFPRRFDSSRVRGVPDTWDLSRTASPRLIEGLRRGLIGLTAGSRLTLRVPAALAWGEEGLRDANVPPRADVLYEIELLEVLP